MRPTSPYAASKAAADLMVQAYIKTHRLPGIVLRGCNNFGPYQYPEKVIPLFVTNLAEGKKVPLYSRGVNSREWIYVEDTCRGVLLALERSPPGETYNVGSGFELTNFDLALMILEEFRRDKSWIAFVADRAAHDLRYHMDSSGFRALGFNPSADFRAQLRKTIDWYRRNEAWWKPLKQDEYTLK